MTINRRCFEYRLIAWIWAFTGLLLVVLVFFFPHIRFAAKASFLSPFILAPLALVFLSLLYMLIKDRTIHKGVPLALGLLFLVFQIRCVKSYYFITGWDSINLLDSALRSVAGQRDPYYESYFSWYPNNILLAVLYREIASFVHSLGKSQNAALEAILYVQCGLSFVTGLAVFKLTEKLTGQRSAALWGYLVYLLLIGLSPWVAIPYSDSAALPVPALLLCLYVSEPQRRSFKIIKWAAIGVLSAFGYCLKPTAAIPAIAIGLLELCRFFETRDCKALAKKAGLLALGVLCAGLLIGKLTDSFEYKIDPEQRIGLVHFFAMGLNEKQMGVWDKEDADYAKSFHTAAERDAAEWQRARERLESMGLKGLLLQGVRKLLTSFHDGTFAWTREGGFFAYVFENESRAATISRSFYYPDGERCVIFKNCMQAIWLSVLLLSTGAFFARGRAAAAVKLTLLGLVLYLLLFEVRARYVYIFAPLFIALAACGEQALFRWIQSIYSDKRGCEKIPLHQEHSNIDKGPTPSAARAVQTYNKADNPRRKRIVLRIRRGSMHIL